MLFYDSVGPNPRVVRIFMAERGIEVPKATIDLRGGENRQASYMAKNPAGQMPCLELDDGSVIAKITAICEYLDEITPAPPWSARRRGSGRKPACGPAASTSTSSSRWPMASASVRG